MLILIPKGDCTSSDFRKKRPSNVELLTTLLYVIEHLYLKLKDESFLRLRVSMQAVAEREVLLERRHYVPEQSNLWDKLSLAQKFAASSLTQFGYDLAFIRGSSNGSIAVLLCNGNAATITGEGEIDTSPNIKIRP